jgi:hypothetical protein
MRSSSSGSARLRCWPPRAPRPDRRRPQQKARVPRIGYLGNLEAAPTVDASRAGLRDLGWIDGRTIAVEYHWYEGHFDRLPRLAAELVGLKVEVIVTASTPAIRAAQQATTTIELDRRGQVGAGITSERAFRNATSSSGSRRCLSRRFLRSRGPAGSDRPAPRCDQLDGAIGIYVHAGPDVFPRIGDAVKVARLGKPRGRASAECSIMNDHRAGARLHSIEARGATP